MQKEAISAFEYFSGFKRGRSLPSLGEEEFSQGAFASCLKIFYLLNFSKYIFPRKSDIPKSYISHISFLEYLKIRHCLSIWCWLKYLWQNICCQRIILNCICYFNQFWEETVLSGYFGDKNILPKKLDPAWSSKWPLDLSQASLVMMPSDVYILHCFTTIYSE